MLNLRTSLLIVCSAAGLAACGGNDDGSSQAPMANTNQVPASATASTAAYRQYVGSLKASDTTRPLDVSTVDKPPTSETEAAAAI